MRVKDLIISEINKKGKIDISEFINLSQYGDSGYYIKQNPIGLNNDFITAPEVSQMFGEIVGLFILNYWQNKIGTSYNLIELGPGRGSLISDILRVGNINKKYIDSINLTLIEKNEKLINLQKKSLKDIGFDKVTWQEEFKIQKKNIPSIIYSNEFFDCFSVRQFYKKKKWIEKFIKYNSANNLFNFTEDEVNDEKILKKLEQFDKIKVAELSSSRKNYFDKVCKFIKRNKGIFLTIDYGYKKPPNYLTLQTIYNHKKTHLFENIGNQDITAHVNFNELINVAKNNELKLEIYCSQKDFLMSCGIEQRKEKLKINKNQKDIETLNLEVDRLTNKSKMGEIFKVLVVSCL
jgi:cyclopropane-fatty-acyl-phospholipid synthase